MTMRERIARRMYMDGNRLPEEEWDREFPQVRESYRELADAALAEIAAAGMVLVPREPTEEQLKAGYTGIMFDCDRDEEPNEADCGRAYRAMLSAAPAGGE
jgi:hypothetical protein